MTYRKGGVKYDNCTRWPGSARSRFGEKTSSSSFCGGPTRAAPSMGFIDAVASPLPVPSRRHRMKFPVIRTDEHGETHFAVCDIPDRDVPFGPPPNPTGKMTD